MTPKREIYFDKLVTIVTVKKDCTNNVRGARSSFISFSFSSKRKKLSITLKEMTVRNNEKTGNEKDNNALSFSDNKRGSTL